MNIETGEIRYSRKDIEYLKNFIRIREDQMTEKQKKEMHASKYDNRSELGKILTKHRKLTRQQRKRFRRLTNE